MQSHCFRDFDAFAASVRDVDSVMMLQNPKHRVWRINHVYLPEVHVQLGRLGSGNIVEGQSWSDGYLLYLPLTDRCAYSANGTVLRKNSFMILEPGCEFCVSTEYQHDWCSIFVPTDKFTVGDDQEEPSSRSEKTTCRVSVANRETARLFRTFVNQVVTTATNYPQFESSPAAGHTAAELIRLGSLAVGQREVQKRTQKGRPTIPRHEIIRRSKQLLEEREGNPVLVRELVAAADVSEGTVRTAFNDYFGVGPTRYLQLRQLHQVHRALKAADPRVKGVADVMMENGVAELSRCAARYRRLFGETPSETLRTRRR